MKKFRFRLATVERVRQVELDQARGTVMLANQALALAEADHADRIGRLTEITVPAGTVSHAQLTLHRFLVEQSMAAVRFADERRCEASAAAEVARAEWRVAKTRVQALERLHEQARDEHHRELRRAEDRHTDEASTTRHLQQAVQQ